MPLINQVIDKGILFIYFASVKTRIVIFVVNVFDWIKQTTDACRYAIVVMTIDYL